MNSVTTGELAEQLGLRIRGDSTRVLHGAALLEEATAHQLGFAARPQFFPAALESAAGCIIAPLEYAGPPGQTVIESPQPRAHFAQALGILYPPAPLLPGVHFSAVIAATASVDASAEIAPGVTIGEGSAVGPGTRVGAGCSIGAGVRIGAGCLLHPRVSVYDRVSIGSRCAIHSGAVIGADGFGFELMGDRYRKVPQVGTVEIGDDVEIGANTCIDRGALDATIIRRGAKLDNLIHLGHNVIVGENVLIAAQTGISGSTTIGNNAIIGGQVGVGDHAHIGENVILGSQAGVLPGKKLRATGGILWGTPAQPLEHILKEIGLLRRLRRKSDAQGS